MPPFGLPVAPPVASAPPAGGGSGWKTILDLDLTAEASQTFDGNGDYTIGGRTWTKRNTANETLHAAIVNGSGLHFAPAAWSYWHPEGYGDPYLWLSSAALFGSTSVDWATQVRIYLSVGAEAGSGANSGIVANLMPLVADNATIPSGLLFSRGALSASGPSMLMKWANNGSATPNFILQAMSDSNKTVCVQCEAFALASVWGKVFYSPVLAPGAPFPALATMRPSGMLTDGSSPPRMTLSAAAGLPTDMGLAIAATSSGSAGYTVTLQRVRVDVRN